MLIGAEDDAPPQSIYRAAVLSSFHNFLKFCHSRRRGATSPYGVIYDCYTLGNSLPIKCERPRSGLFSS